MCCGQYFSARLLTIESHHYDLGTKTEMATAHTLRKSRGHVTNTQLLSEINRATAAGTRYGVAKKANIYAVKVLSDEG